MKLILGLVLGSIILIAFLYVRDRSSSSPGLEIKNFEGTVPLNTGDNNTNQSLLAPEEELITNFFGLINNGQIPEAVSIMSARAVPDDSAKQAWGVQFNAIRSAHVLKIEEVSQDTWTETSKEYKVTLEIFVDESAYNAPIPYYGWEDNPNIRFITVTKDGSGVWKIDQIGTGL